MPTTRDVDTPDSEEPVRVVRVGFVVISHHPTPPDLDYARRECRFIRGLLDELERPAAILTLADRVLPVVSSEVMAIYREHAKDKPIAAWAAVVAGVMGFAASIALSIGANVFARGAPMRVFQRIPRASEWLAEQFEAGASPSEIRAAAEQLRQRP